MFGGISDLSRSPTPLRCSRVRQVYRRYSNEFMDILLEREKDSDETNLAHDISRWAPRQFICPITQVRDGIISASCLYAHFAYV